MEITSLLESHSIYLDIIHCDTLLYNDKTYMYEPTHCVVIKRKHDEVDIDKICSTHSINEDYLGHCFGFKECSGLVNGTVQIQVLLPNGLVIMHYFCSEELAFANVTRLKSNIQSIITKLGPFFTNIFKNISSNAHTLFIITIDDSDGFHSINIQ